jgi:hypothetical protein
VSDVCLQCSASKGREVAGEVRARRLTDSGGGARLGGGHGDRSRCRNAAGRRVQGSRKEGSDTWVNKKGDMDTLRIEFGMLL